MVSKEDDILLEVTIPQFVFNRLIMTIFQLPMGVPPILPDVQQQLHDYIAYPENLLINDFEKLQQNWKREANPENLLFCDLAKLPTSLRMNRDPTTGELLGILEIANDGSSLIGNEINFDLVHYELNNVTDADIGLCGGCYLML